MNTGLISPHTDARQLGQRIVTTLLLDGDFITEVTKRVKEAQRSIWICAYTWRWYENAPEKNIQRFNTSVLLKAKHGIDVKALMHQATDAQKLRGYGINTKVLPTKRVMHTKAIVIDGEIMIIGSHNLTERGTSENYECSLLVADSEAVMLFNEYFARMWQNFAEQ